MSIVESIAEVLLFPGFVFTAVVGLLASWVDRKVTARVQWRVGPPWYQGFADIVKLLGKETLVPAGASRGVFLSAPLVFVAGITLISTLLWMADIYPNSSFIGDVIVVVYLLEIPAICVMMGGFASANPLASLGASREMKLFLSYELPFVLALLVPIIKVGGTIRIGDIIMHQSQHGIVAGNVSGAIALVVAVLCMQAKLTLIPFDIPDAETEIIGGPYIEYSGSALALYKLGKAMLLVAVPLFVVIMFMGGIRVTSAASTMAGIGKYVTLLVAVILIKNTNPRVRIDQAVRFFWGPVTLLAVIAVVLAMIGL